MGRRTTIALLVALATALAAAGCSGAGSDDQITLRLLGMDQAAYSAESIDKMVADFEEANPNIDVEVTLVAVETLHDKITVDQASGEGEFDVVLVDEIWPSEFAAAEFIQEVGDRLSQEQKDGIIPEVQAIMNVGDNVYGIPWILDSKYLFYNKDMLAEAGFDEPPATLDELVEQAQAIKDAGIVEYPMVWSWGQAEAVIVDYAAFVYSFGGELLAADGTPKLHEPEAVEGVQWMVDTLEAGLTNPNSTSYLEEDVRQVFSQGEAAFALNWTYMYGLANDPEESAIAGKAGIAPIPAGPAGIAAPSGSMGFSLTASTEHPDEAWDLITHLTSFDQQKEYAVESLPVWERAFENPDELNAPPELVEVAGVQFAATKARPGFVTWYNQWSIATQVVIQEILLGSTDPQEGMSKLAEDIPGLASS